MALMGNTKAYRSGSKLIEQIFDKDGKFHEVTNIYEHKRDVVFSKIFVPVNAPDWCLDREALWNRVIKAENRNDGHLARKMDVALQKEFSLKQNIELISEFVNVNFISSGLIADVNIHHDNLSNPHVHITLSTRELVAKKYQAVFILSSSAFLSSFFISQSRLSFKIKLVSLAFLLGSRITCA